jgi:lysophospholipase L1-like esterase
MHPSARLTQKFLTGLLLAGFLSTALAVEAPPATKPAATPAAKSAVKAPPVPAGNPAVAAPKAGNEAFFRQHESFLKRGKEGPIGVLFLGDSITAGWAKAPDVWKKFYGEWQPANFGIGGDRTEHVLWRIEQGELEGIKPKVTVLMIGTNNTGVNTAPDIAAGVRKIVQQIRSKLPETKVLLLGVFPRGPRSADPAVVENAAKSMEKIKAINADIAKLDDGKTVRFLDLSEKFLVDGKIPNDVMPDQLHPNAKGYQIWADAMHPLLTEMMK